jgi:hypothetical protein
VKETPAEDDTDADPLSEGVARAIGSIDALQLSLALDDSVGGFGSNDTDTAGDELDESLGIGLTLSLGLGLPLSLSVDWARQAARRLMKTSVCDIVPGALTTAKNELCCMYFFCRMRSVYG